MIAIRQESPTDFAAVYRLNALAFEREDEAKLIEKLRRADWYVSLVAVLNDEIVGHIFFSSMTIEPEIENFKACGLAPMAVLPDFQNQGIGSALVRAGLKECAARNCDAVFVLGHAEYYPRFGFVPAKTKNFSSEYPVPDEVFMVLELKPDALCEKSGLAKYRPEFAEV